jgi:hypothetical protein
MTTEQLLAVIWVLAVWAVFAPFLGALIQFLAQSRIRVDFKAKTITWATTQDQTPDQKPDRRTRDR